MDDQKATAESSVQKAHADLQAQISQDVQEDTQ